ncbi:hypothetical protein N602_29680 [Mycobacterium avium subsp. hominissuis 10-5606]|nr:hypothetical protein N602_29680 [Mycobacterium avium subsp. hominissuis 10-5606]
MAFKAAQDLYIQIDLLVGHRELVPIGRSGERDAALEMLSRRALAYQVEALAFTEITAKSSPYVRIREATVVIAFMVAYLFPLVSALTGIGQIQVPNWVSVLVAVVWYIVLVGSALSILMYVNFKWDVIYTARQMFMADPENAVPRTYLEATSGAELRTLLRADFARERAHVRSVMMSGAFMRFCWLVFRWQAMPVYAFAIASRLPPAVTNLAIWRLASTNTARRVKANAIRLDVVRGYRWRKHSEDLADL